MSDVAAQPAPEEPRSSAAGLGATAPPQVRSDVSHADGTGSAGRLLTPAQAKQVIARALELQQAEGPGIKDGLSLRDVQDVASQVGVDPTLIRRAMTDVRIAAAAEYEPSRTERLLGPRSVSGATVVAHSAEQVRRGAANWMTYDEGMKMTGSRGDVDRWVKDKRLLVEMRLGLQATKAESVLRDLKSVTVQVEEEDEGTLVTVEANTSAIRTATTSIVATGVVAGVLTGIGAAAVIPDTAFIASDIGQFVTNLGIWSGGGVAIASVVSRSWASRVREAVDGALDGIRMSTTRPDIPRPPSAATGWKRTALNWLGGDR